MSEISISPTISNRNVLQELGFSETPTVEQLDKWRTKALPSAPLGSIGFAFADDRLNGLTAKTDAGWVTVRWFAVATVNETPSLLALLDIGSDGQTKTVLEMIYLADVASVPVRDDAKLVATITLEQTLRRHMKTSERTVDSSALAFTPESSAPRPRFLPESSVQSAPAFRSGFPHSFAPRDLLKGLVHAIAAPVPSRSTGQWIIDHCMSELPGEIGRTTLDDGGHATLEVRRVVFTEWMHGFELRLHLRLTIWDSVGTIIHLREQSLSGDAFSIKLMYDPVVDETLQEMALAQLRRWRVRESRHFAARGEAVRNMYPTELVTRAPLCALCVATLHGGPPGAPPVAGTLGPAARASAARLREVSTVRVKPRGSELVRAYEVDGFTILFDIGMMAATDDGAGEILTFDRIRLSHGSERPVAILYSGLETCSADGDVAAFRLFAQWLRMALQTHQLDRPFGDRRLPSEWLRFGERGGAVIDHRIETGILSSEEDYRKLTPEECGFIVDDGDDLAAAQWLLRFFIRHVIDPDAHWNVGRSVASMWDQMITRPTLDQ